MKINEAILEKEKKEKILKCYKGLANSSPYSIEVDSEIVNKIATISSEISKLKEKILKTILTYEVEVMSNNEENEKMSLFELSERISNARVIEDFYADKSLDISSESIEDSEFNFCYKYIENSCVYLYRIKDRIFYLENLLNEAYSSIDII